MKKRLWLILFVFTVTLTRCSQCFKDPVLPFIGLPLETQTGAGTFACLINGEVWVYKDPKQKAFSLKISPETNWYVDLKENGGSFGIIGYRAVDEDFDALSLKVDSIKIFNERRINSNSLNLNISFSPNNSKCGEYFTSDKGTWSNGKITITKLDTIARIISGRFNCQIYRSKCADTLKITDGRFDVKF